MRLARRAVVLSLAVVVIGFVVLFILNGSRTLHSGCEIAQLFFHPNEETSFETFLEKQFRMYGVSDPGGLLSDPQYEFAIYHTNKQHNEYKLYQYQVSRSGILHSRMALSISKKEWEHGSRVKCD